MSAARRSRGTPLVAHVMDDDGVLLWLSDHSQAAADFAASFLDHYSGNGVGSDTSGHAIPKAFTHGGLKRIYAGRAATQFIGVSPVDERVPDVIGIAQHGKLWAGAKLSKISDHGGNAADDRHVPIIVWGAGIGAGRTDEPVQTTQIAPTILRLLRLPANELQAVRIEHTPTLPQLQLR